MWQEFQDGVAVPHGILVGKRDAEGKFRVLGYRLDNQLGLIKKYDKDAPHFYAQMPEWLLQGPPYPQWTHCQHTPLAHDSTEFVMGRTYQGKWQLLGLHAKVSGHRWHVTRHKGDVWYAALPDWVYQGP